MNGALTTAVKIEPGTLVAYRGGHCTVLVVLNLQEALLREHGSGQTVRAALKDICRATSIPEASPGKVHRDLAAVADEDWQEAQRRLALIRPLLRPAERTRESVRARAREGGVHPATLYRWIERFELEGKTSALLPNQKHGGRGKGRLKAEVEALTQVTIQEVYLTAQRLSARKTWEEVVRRCRAAGLEAPHENTVRERIARLRQRDRLQARHGRRAAEALDAVPGEFAGANFPLAVIQIDHTELDVTLVDEGSRQAIGRPWITLAIDLYSRMVAGYHVSLDPPGTVSIALCLVHAILPKDVWLARHNLDVKWPCWGLPTVVHADNAHEFRGNALRRACEQYGIGLEWRPVKKPRYGAHIERLTGTLLQEIHTLPGSTFSSVKDRGAYEPARRAALTLRELESWLAVHVAGVYHQREHAALLGSNPLHRYEEGILGDATRPGCGVPQRIADEQRLLLDFLPYVERTIQPNGIVVDKIRYYDEVLARYISVPEPGGRGVSKRKFIFRRDPRDISVIHFFDPQTDTYHPVPYRNTSWPPVSIWELREVRRSLRAENRRHINEAIIFAALERKRAIVENAVAQTQRTRRERARRAVHAARSQKRPQAPDSTPLLQGEISRPDIEPFEEVE